MYNNFTQSSIYFIFDILDQRWLVQISYVTVQIYWQSKCPLDDWIGTNQQHIFGHDFDLIIVTYQKY